MKLIEIKLINIERNDIFKKHNRYIRIMSRGHGERGRNSGNRSKSSRNLYRHSSRTSTRITRDRARAIQSHADKTGRNQDFKSRAMSAADKNEK